MTKPITLDWPAIHGRVKADWDKLQADRDMSLSALCSDVGVDNANMRKFLKSDGGRQLSVESVTRIADATGKTVSWYLLGDDMADPAAPTLIPAQAETPAPQGLDYIPHDRIQPWDQNPRKHFDEAAIQELADNMRDQANQSGGTGMLQNIVVRPHPDHEDRYQIISGERRWRAIGLNIDAIHMAPAVPVLCMIRQASDADALAIAIAENVERRDMTPLEEARAYRALQDLRTAESGDPVSAGQIAEELGVNKRTVQLRLELVDKLTTETQTALDSGEISLAIARVLTAAAPADQNNALAAIRKHPNHWETAEDVRDLVFGDMVAVGDTPAEVIQAYENQGGEIVVDPDGGEEGDTFFQNRVLFEQLFADHLDSLRTALESDFSEVQIYDKNKYFHASDWVENTEHPAAIAIIDIDWQQKITIRKGLISRATERKAERNEKAGKDITDPDPEPATKTHLLQANLRMTQALQGAVLADPESALRCVIVALLARREFGSDNAFEPVNIRSAGHRTLSADVREALAEIDPDLAKGASDHPGQKELFQTIAGLSGADLLQAFAAAVAAHVEIPWHDYKSAENLYGTPDTALALASHLGIPGREAEFGLAEPRDDDLDGLRKPGLLAILRDTYDADTADQDFGAGKVADIKEAATSWSGRGPSPSMHTPKDYVLPTHRFGTSADIRAIAQNGTAAAAAGKTKGAE